MTVLGEYFLKENEMFRCDNNGQITLNRTILDRVIRYWIVLCNDSDPYTLIILDKDSLSKS